MKQFAALSVTLAAAPAWAHDGMHVHPHGGETWIAWALAAGFVGLATLLLRR